MSFIVRGVRLMSNACGVLAALLLIAACAVVCQMVFVRSVLGASTVWQTEFILYSIVAATLIGSPYVLAAGGHVSMDLVSHYAGGRARRVLAVLASCAGTVFCGVLAWSGWRYFAEAWTEGWVTESVWAPPLWIVLAPLPIGIGMLTLQYAADLLCLLFGQARGRFEPEHELLTPLDSERGS